MKTIYLLLLCIINAIQSASCKRRLLEDGDVTPTLGMIGGDKIAKKFNELFEDIKQMEGFKTLGLKAQQLIDQISEKENRDDFIMVFGGERYVKYISDLRAAVVEINNANAQLMSLTHKTYSNAGHIGKRIARLGYHLDTQERFGEFLENGMKEAEKLLEKFNRLHNLYNKLKGQSESNDSAARAWEKRELKALEDEHWNTNHHYWWCFTIIGCPIAASVVEIQLKPEVEKRMKLVMKQQDEVQVAVKEGEKISTKYLEQICRWKPQLRKLKDGLGATKTNNDNVLEALQENFLKTHPNRAGTLNAYTIELFEQLQTLQKTCKGIDGFDMDFVKALGGEEVTVPEERTAEQPKVCDCVILGVDNNWWKSSPSDPTSKCEEAVQNIMMCDPTDGGTVQEKKCKQSVIDRAVRKYGCTQKRLNLEWNCDWQCYLDRYPDLKKEYGSNQKAAQDHYQTKGVKEKRDCTCPKKESETTSSPRSKISGDKIKVSSYSLTSTYHSLYPAKNCFDGNTNTMCHGKKSSGDTLTAGISRADVTQVRIYNRKDSKDRIKGAEVRVGGQLCGVVQSTVAVIDVTCPRPLSGTVVTLKTKHYLNIMELEIFGTPKKKPENKQKIPKNCEGDWSEWSSCSKDCDGGLRSRSFTTTRPAENGGYECPESPAFRSCNAGVACPCKESLESLEGGVVKNPEEDKVYYIAGGERHLLTSSPRLDALIMRSTVRALGDLLPTPTRTTEICARQIVGTDPQEIDSIRNFCQEIKLTDKCVSHKSWPMGRPLIYSNRAWQHTTYAVGTLGFERARTRKLCKGRQNEINMGVEAAYAMKLAYEADSGMSMPKYKLLDFGWSVLANHAGSEQGGWRALVWEKPGVCLVSFKGSTSFGNWAQANLQAAPLVVGNMNVHTGFYMMAMHASKKLKQQFGRGKYCSQKKIVITGHSLGAAVADVFTWAVLRGAFDLQKRKKTDVTTVTFAQPQTFLKSKWSLFGWGGRTVQDCPKEIYNNPRSYRYVLTSRQRGKTLYDPLPHIQLPTLKQSLFGWASIYDYHFKHCNKGIEIQIDSTESNGLKIYKVHEAKNWPTGKDDFKFLWTDTNLLALGDVPLHMQHRYKRAMDANGYDGTCRTNYN